MALSLAALTLLVRDYDPAIQWFKRCLGFELLEDTPLSPTKRWVKLAPASGNGAALLLARAANACQRSQIGRQSGGRVFLFLQTTRFWTDYRRMKAAGVEFAEDPRHEPYGWVVVFLDLCGNRWDLVQAPSRPRRAPRKAPRKHPHREVPVSPSLRLGGLGVTLFPRRRRSREGRQDAKERGK